MPITPRIIEAADLFRARLLARERRAAGGMVRYYGTTWQRLQGDITALSAEVNAMRAAGEEVTRGQIVRLERMRAIQVQVEQELGQFAVYADEAIVGQKRESIFAGERESAALIEYAFPPGAGISISHYQMPRAAVENLAGFLQDGSPLRDIIAGYVGSAADDFAETMVSGLAQGLGPRQLARELRQAYGMGLTDALRLSRTENLRAYRTASRQTYEANSDVLKGWQRHADKSDTTCMACFVDWKTPILTSTGFRPIAKIKPGELVMTHMGRFRRVTEAMRQNVDEAKVVTIRADMSGGKQLGSLTMTIEHPVLTKRGWVRAGLLTISDEIAVTTKPCELCGEPVIYRYRGNKLCSRSCVGKVSARALHDNQEAHDRAVANMTATHHAMMARGEHPFQDPDIIIRRTRAALRANSLLTSSRTEGVLAEHFDSIGLEYETQWPIYSHYVESNNRHYHYYADFAFPEQMLAVEADGEPWHSWDDARIEHDKRRQRRMESQGWQVLHYTGSEIHKDAAGIAQEVKAILMNHEGRYGRGWVRIKSIKHSVRKPPSSRFKVVRYNLEVEEDHSYVAKYAVVHNCILLDGKLYALATDMDDHANGKCSMLPVTKTYAELGIDAPEPQFQDESAREWFERQPESIQRQMMGGISKDAYDAWQAGLFSLEDIPHVSHSDLWGDSWTPKPMYQLLGVEKQRSYTETVAEMMQ